MADYQEIFIKNLKTLRKERNLTQWRLAELCEISNGTIGNIECGVTKPSFDLMIKFAKVMEISPAQFFHCDENKERKTISQKEKLSQIKKNIIDFIEKEFNGA